jgi:hypothetical protein
VCSRVGYVTTGIALQTDHQGRRTAILLLAVYAAVTIFHVALLSSYMHAGIGIYFRPDGSTLVGALIGDEGWYRLYAERLLHLQTYSSFPLYPPAYPLLLAIAELVHPADPIAAMVVGNIVVATAVMFPVYALARQILPRDLSFSAAIAASLLPASFVFAPALMSENLSTTLFVMAFWLAVRQRQQTIFTAGLFGFLLAACFLSKYLFLAIIPFLCATYIINQTLVTAPTSANFKSTRALIADRLSAIFAMRRLIVVAAAAGLIPIGLWCAYVIASGGTASESLGLHIATLAANSHRTLVPNLLKPILGLHGIAIVAMELPILPVMLVGLFGPRPPAVTLYAVSLGVMTGFMWLFVSMFVWFSLRTYEYPEPIALRYMMMLVPLFVPLAFFGIEQILSRKTGWQTLEATFAGGLLFLALAAVVKSGFYDRTIWHVPAWTTVMWVGACDALYGALGFPIITVTTIAVSMLVVVKLVASWGATLDLTRQRALRLAVIAVTTAGFAAFNVATGLAGARFAWHQPYVEISAAHARAIVAIIGDRNRDPRPAIVTINQAVSDNIEAATGIRSPTEVDWELNLSFWSGRQITTVSAQPLYFFYAPEKLPPNEPRYSVSVASPGDDSDNTYQVGTDKFQVKDAATP